MSYEFYKIVHLSGLFLAMIALAGALGLTVAGGNEPVRKKLAMGHGISVLIVFITGFGMHAKLNIEGMPGWFIAKVVLWLLLGAMVAVPRRAADLTAFAFIALPIIAILGTWLAIQKPF